MPPYELKREAGHMQISKTGANWPSASELLGAPDYKGWYQAHFQLASSDSLVVGPQNALISLMHSEGQKILTGSTVPGRQEASPNQPWVRRQVPSPLKDSVPLHSLNMLIHHLSHLLLIIFV